MKPTLVLLMLAGIVLTLAGSGAAADPGSSLVVIHGNVYASQAIHLGTTDSTLVADTPKGRFTLYRTPYRATNTTPEPTLSDSILRFDSQKQFLVAAVQEERARLQRQLSKREIEALVLPLVDHSIIDSIRVHPNSLWFYVKGGEGPYVQLCIQDQDNGTDRGSPRTLKERVQASLEKVKKEIERGIQAGALVIVPRTSGFRAPRVVVITAGKEAAIAEMFALLQGGHPAGVYIKGKLAEELRNPASADRR